MAFKNGEKRPKMNISGCFEATFWDLLAIFWAIIHVYIMYDNIKVKNSTLDKIGDFRNFWPCGLGESRKRAKEIFFSFSHAIWVSNEAS